MRKAKVIHEKKLELEEEHGGPLTCHRGICSKTVENPMMTVTHVIIPPGSRNHRHYHVNCDTGMYLLKGCMKMFSGPDHEMEETVVGPKDFVFVSQGEIYGLMNPSDTEPAEFVAVKAVVGNIEEEESIFVEPR